MPAGELAALEDIVGMLINKQPQPLLKPIVVKAVAWLCDRAHQQACSSQVRLSRPLRAGKVRIGRVMLKAECWRNITSWAAHFYAIQGFILCLNPVC